MNNLKTNLKPAMLILRWAARLGSIVSIVLILLFFIGEGFNPAAFTPRECIGFIFFPVGIIIGMIVAWKHEGIGGSITIGSLLAFYLVYFLFNSTIPRGWAWGVFVSPGILFLAFWAFSRKK